MNNWTKKSTYMMTYHGHGVAEPIGLEYIAGTLSREGYEIEFISHNEFRIKKPGECKISFLSGLTCEWPIVVKQASISKRQKYITVVGGYHVSGTPIDTIDGSIFDFIIKGEGEHETQIIVRELMNNKKAFGSTIPKEIVADKINNIDQLTQPFRLKNFLEEYKIFDFMWPPKPQQKNVALVLASRGCSNSCDFCASAAVWGRGVRFRSPKNVVAELQDLKSRFDTNTVVFIDQSLGQAKQWTLDLCAAIQKANLGLNWYHQSNLTIDLNTIKKMAEVGCRKIGFGLEGISPFAVDKIKPLNPHDYTAINTLFDYCNSLGIFVKVYLMIGFPWETEAIVNDYFEWIQKLRANQVKISYMTPFPGTRDWKRYSEQLISRNWADFDTVSIPVVYNPNITVQRYHYVRKALFKKFYGSKTYGDVTGDMLKKFPHYAESYLEFAEYLRTYDMITGNEEWLQWVKYPNEKKYV